MTRDTKSIAIGVFLALVAFRLFEMVWREVEGSFELPVLLVILVLVAVAVYAATTKRNAIFAATTRRKRSRR